MKVLFWRLVENVTSVLEGCLIWLQFTIAGFVVGIYWTGKEIFDSWTLGERMNFKLLPYAGRVWKKAWSIKFGLASSVFSAMEIGLPMFSASIPHGPFAVLSMLAAAGSVIARLYAQKEFRSEPRQRFTSAGQ